jgi:thioredoxin-like negative regulator of GroEL
MSVETITAQNWHDKVESSNVPMVVNFSAVRCGFCKALEPLYNRLAEQYAGKLSFAKIMADDSQNQKILDRVGIEGTPTLKFYCRGREVGEHIGYAIEPVLKKKIDGMLEEMETCLSNSTPLKS